MKTKKWLNMLNCHVIYEVMSPAHKCILRRHCSASRWKVLTDVVELISVYKTYNFGITLTCRHAGETVMYSSTLMLPLAGVVVNTSHCALPVCSCPCWLACPGHICRTLASADKRRLRKVKIQRS